MHEQFEPDIINATILLDCTLFKAILDQIEYGIYVPWTGLSGLAKMF